MATAVIMPRQGQSVESCLIGKWHKLIGDKISVGDLLFTYETDKATFEEESKIDGVLLDIFYAEGDDVECLQNVCVIGNEGESIEEFRPGNLSGQQKSSSSTVLASETNPSSPRADETTLLPLDASTISSPPNRNLYISPRARMLAEKTGADISRAVPTGANNRIMERDIQKVVSDGFLSTRAVGGIHPPVTGTGIGGRVTTVDAASTPHSTETKINTPDSEDVALTNVRKFIAKAMHASLANSAQLTLHSSFDATDVFEFRKKLKAAELPGALSKATVTDIIICATSRVLLKHKSISAHFNNDKMTLFNNAHIGVAVDTPRGLLVPTLFNANALSLSELSAQAKVLFDKCKQGSIEPDNLKGASFTISNLGGLGIEMFTPILNPPQTGLLGVCNVIERLKDGKPYPALGLSITFDHRALDGADAARFLKDLVQYLENFSFNLALEGAL